MSRSDRPEFDRRPSALRYMARALLPKRHTGRPESLRVPPLAARWRGWRGWRASARERSDFARLSGARDDAVWWPLFVHATAFRLSMALLTGPEFPLPIWRMLQIRNHVLARGPRPFDEALDLDAHIVGTRVLAKGVEIDLRCAARPGGEAAWASLTTFYVRGRFGAPQAGSPLARSPEADGAEAARWQIPLRGALRFAALTGDYNGLHLLPAYARRFGYEHAFAHPQRVLGHCLARLPRPAAQTLRLEVWLKGPAYYGRDLTLQAREEGGATVFCVRVGAEPRPALVARLRAAGAGESLEAN